MGGIAITSWAERYPERVPQRADAVALINTTTGDLLRNVQFAPRAAAAWPTPASVRQAPCSRRSVRRRFSARWIGPADGSSRRSRWAATPIPPIAEFIYELFTSTPPAGRGGWARALVDTLGPEHIGLKNLTVPTLVIGSEKDRLLPMVSSRRIAEMAPNLAQFVELSGGHCAIVERPDEVNKQLRLLIESVSQERSA